jgi:hypothetical protein
MASEHKESVKQSKSKIVLNKKHFRTKKSVKQYFKSILDDSNVGDELEGDQLEEFKDLAALHPRYADGINEISTVQIGKIMQNKNFNLIFDNGEECVVSYLKCIASKPHAKYIRGRVQKCARLAIRSQIQKFREITPLVCAISGDKLDKSDSHVDHDFNKKTFQSLLDDWLAYRNWTYPDIKIEWCEESELDRMSSKYRKSWRKYHRKHATLRIIKKELNLSGKRMS